MIKGGITYKIVTDHIGSVRQVVNTSNGTVIQKIDYDEFGQVLSDSNEGFQPFGFAGGLYDPNTRLVRFGARDYDAETGRWTSKDPILFNGGQGNLYVYVGNDPINKADYTGTYGIALGFSGGIGALWGFTGGLGIVIDSVTGVDLFYTSGEGHVVGGVLGGSITGTLICTSGTDFFGNGGQVGVDAPIGSADLLLTPAGSPYGISVSYGPHLSTGAALHAYDTFTGEQALDLADIRSYFLGQQAPTGVGDVWEHPFVWHWDHSSNSSFAPRCLRIDRDSQLKRSSCAADRRKRYPDTLVPCGDCLLD